MNIDRSKKGESPITPLAFFISPHGYGHAARSASVMASIQLLHPSFHFHIFTLVPECFFKASLDEKGFTWHSLKTDIGLVQSTALNEDLDKTVAALNSFLPFDTALINNLADRLNQLNCQLLLCDISPLGIAVARQAHIRSVLIENFSWDWIYQGYLNSEPGFQKAITYLQDHVHAADFHIQTKPFCYQYPADLRVSPVSRKPRTSPEQIKQQLKIPDHTRLVLITMGGIPEKNYQFLKRVQEQDAFYCLIPGASDDYERHHSLIMLPHHSNFYHPDLIHAADLVIGKLGYSTLAETYAAGIPFAYITRQDFRETESLSTFADTEMNGWSITESHLQSGDWLENLDQHLQKPRINRDTANGADEIAGFVLPLLKVTSHY